MSPASRKKMSDEHKEALARGRQLSRTVNAYLTALEENRPKRGRKRTAESIQKRLATIDASLADASPVKRLQLTQERLDLEAELVALDNAKDDSDLESLEADFVAIAKEYSDSQGITKAAWRELGVPSTRTPLRRDLTQLGGCRAGQAVPTPTDSNDSNRTRPSAEPSSGLQARSG